MWFPFAATAKCMTARPVVSHPFRIQMCLSLTMRFSAISINLEHGKLRIV